MKLRQKLAVVLASAMVVTSVPVVTMAASDNGLSKETVIVKENASFTQASTASQVKVNFKDFDTTNGETFYLTLENATWNKTDANELKDGQGAWVPADSNVKVTVISDTEARVEVKKGYDATKALYIPVLATVKSGDATVAIKKMGSLSTVTEGKWVFASTTENVAHVKVGTLTSFYKSGSIADVIITEAMANAFQTTDGTHKTVKLTVGHSDFDFDVAGFTLSADGKYYEKEVAATYSYGFTNSGLSTIKASVSASDKQVMTLELPNNLKADSQGVITVKGLKVKATTKTPQTGDFTIDISGTAVTDQRDVVVAKVAQYGTSLTIKDDKVVEIVAGQKADVEFTIKENVEDSLSSGRTVEFKLNKGYFAVEGKNDAETLSNLNAAIKSLKHGKNDITVADVIVEDEKVVGFEVVVPATSTTELDKITVKASVSIGLGEEGDVTLTASGRAISEELSTVVAKAKKAIAINTEAAVLKVGLKGQKAGKITVKETEKATIKNGKTLEVLLPVQNGITFAEKPEVKVTEGDLQVGDVKIQDVKDANGKVTAQKVTIQVKRASRTASTLEISNFTIDTDRTVAEGSYNVEVGGEAITSLKDSVKVADFIVIGTPNTEDLGTNGLRRGTSTFVIGEAKYTVNGVEKTMDAKSYVQNPGYTMVPVRYVAEAFGVVGTDVLFGNGTVTIFAGSRTIQLKNGSDIATVNGAQIKMETKVVIKEGRTYAPIGEVAKLLGVEKAWDNTSKTATFTNK